MPQLLLILATALAAAPPMSVPVFAPASSDPAAVVVSPGVEVTDIRGRRVALPAGEARIAIDDARYLVALSLLLDDPTTPLVGWPHDGHRIGGDLYDRYEARFPRLPTLGRVSSSAEAFSLEQMLAAGPRVAVFSLGRGPSDAQVAQLERAGVVSVFVDFFIDPLANVDRSLEILGAVVGRDRRAAEIVAFRAERRAAIESAVGAAGLARPDVFLEPHAGMSEECCNSPGRGNVGVYIEFAGGRNIGADILPGAVGRLSLEYVLERDPDVYVGTGGPHLAGTAGLVMGDGYGADTARESLERIAARDGIRLLSAVRNGRVHGLSHQLLNSPLDVVALELLARWLHPEALGHLDPGATLRQLNTRFLAVPLDGTFWVSSPLPSEHLPR
ncbi:ABC transporter substrate-binding protein [Gemmatimonadota bacterium Y43]|uniref:ABC transporter substrate-binding protein n=1 Tax=Gaopeijia maritima TaxID=3119007 RepID=UPI003277495B